MLHSLVFVWSNCDLGRRVAHAVVCALLVYVRSLMSYMQELCKYMKGK